MLLVVCLKGKNLFNIYDLINRVIEFKLVI